MQAKIGIGLAALGRPGYINLGHAEDLKTNYSVGAMQKNAHSVLDTAWELGIRYFDAARSYGRAEEFLATWIRERNIAANDIKVGSKWGYTYTAAWKVHTPAGVGHEVKRHELKVLQSQFQTSMKYLSKHLDLYQIHSATIESGVLENNAVLDCLNGLKKSGIQIGLTVSGARQSETIEKALTIRFDGELLFGSVQATWNLLETSAAGSLKKAHAAGMDVMIKEGLANGRLTSRNNTVSFAQRRATLEAMANERETTIDAISLAAALNQGWATTVLSGAATPEQLRSNFKAAQIDWTEEMQLRLGSIKQSPVEYWDDRSRMAWN